MAGKYPDLDHNVVSKLRVIAAQAALDPNYWDDECPYERDVIEILRGDTYLPSEGEPNSDEWTDLEAKMTRLLNRLEQEGEKFAGMETNEKISWFKTMTQLLDKLVSMKERALGVAKIHEFTQTVLDIMEDVLDQDQRADAMARIKAKIG